MTETLYDKYMQDPEFATAMNHENEIMMLTERIAALEKENARLKKVTEFKSNYCDRKHAFCPDCRDKLPDNFCWRCESQRLESKNESLKAELTDRDEQEGKLVTDLADLYERFNELREAAAWFADEELYLPDDGEEAEFNKRQSVLRALLDKQEKEI